MAALNAAIVAAAGSGSRLGTGRSKILLDLGGEPLLLRTLRALGASRLIHQIYLAVRSADRLAVQSLLRTSPCPKLRKVVAGGRRRQDSVWQGLKVVPGNVELVLVHDGARPFVSPAIISRCVAAARKMGAAVPAIPIADTVKRGAASSGTRRLTCVAETLPRETLWQVQTPQVFRRDLLLAAYRHALRRRLTATDDAALVEAMGHSVALVEGDEVNIKITTPHDLRIARLLVQESHRKGGR